MTDEISEAELARPSVIGILRLTGILVFWLSLISGALVLILSFRCVEDCTSNYNQVLAFERSPMLIPFAFAVMIGGWVQQVLLHGFSAGLEQLFEIRKNTSK